MEPKRLAALILLLALGLFLITRQANSQSIQSLSSVTQSGCGKDTDCPPGQSCQNGYCAPRFKTR